MTSLPDKTYSVQIIRSGQPRPYADTEREYLITVQSSQYGKDGMKPWLMYGGMDNLHQEQREWAKKLVRALCQNFREKDDDDGRTGMGAYFFPTLKWLKLDPKAGTIHAFIVEPYTD